MNQKRNRFELRLTEKELIAARHSAENREVSVSEMIRAFLKRTTQRDRRDATKERAIQILGTMAKTGIAQLLYLFGIKKIF